MALTTLKEFRKENPDLKGKRLILCEHLKNKTMDNVDINLWVGDNTRMLLCPVCTKVHVQTVWNRIWKMALAIMAIDKQHEYLTWLDEAGKDKT